MKVYLLIESCGDLGDYHEYVHSIYSDSDKAESIKVELEIVADKVRKCAECVCSGFCIPNCDCEGIDKVRTHTRDFSRELVSVMQNS